MMNDAGQTRAFYDRIAPVYDLLADAAEHGAREAGERQLGLRPGERVLELGPGTGHSLAAFARASGERGRVYGIDVSPAMLEQARRRLEGEGLDPRVELVLGDARALPLPSTAFDAGFLAFTLELFEEGGRRSVLSELRRVLRPDGRVTVVAMAEPRDGEHESLLERAYVWMHRHFPHIVDCRPIDVDAELERGGFRVCGSEERTIWTMPVRVVTARAGSIAARTVGRHATHPAAAEDGPPRRGR